MNLNGKQLIAILIAVLSVLAASTAQLNDIFGPVAAKYIVSVAGLLTACLSTVLMVTTSQSSVVRDVAAMPGVSQITVNAQANKALAAIAMDPAADKVAASPEAAATVAQTAKGT